MTYFCVLGFLCTKKKKKKTEEFQEWRYTHGGQYENTATVITLTGDRCPSKKQPRGDPHRHSLPPYVCEAIGPLSESLTTETLLSKCAHGRTQNNNARERCSGERGWEGQREPVI